MLLYLLRCTFYKINAVFKSLWGKKLTDYANVSEMLKRFETGFLAKQAKTFTPQEVCFHFIKMLLCFYFGFFLNILKKFINFFNKTL